MRWKNGHHGDLLEAIPRTPKLTLYVSACKVRAETRGKVRAEGRTALRAGPCATL